MSLNTPATFRYPHKNTRKFKRVVDVYDPLAIEVIQECVDSQPKYGWRLFRASAVTLRRNLKLLTTDLGWIHIHFVPHSLRYGGAVYNQHCRGMTLPDVQIRGRWKKLETCQAYFEKGMAQLFDFQFPPEHKGRLQDSERTKHAIRNLLRQQSCQ